MHFNASSADFRSSQTGLVMIPIRHKMADMASYPAIDCSGAQPFWTDERLFQAANLIARKHSMFLPVRYFKIDFIRNLTKFRVVNE